jgi:hypothetical protein
MDGFDNSALPSPPTSNPSSARHDQGNEVRYLQDPWPPVEMGFMPQSEGTDLDFFSDSSWANQPFQTLMGAPCALPDNDVSFPDTSMYEDDEKTEHS